MPGRPKAIPQHGYVSSFLLCEALFLLSWILPRIAAKHNSVLSENCQLRQLERIRQCPIQFALLVGRQGTDEVSQFSLKHQGEKIAANRALLRKAHVTPDDDLGSKSQGFAVNGSTNNGRDIFVAGNEIARNDDIETRLRTAFGYFLPRSIYLAASQDFACSFTSAAA